MPFAPWEWWPKGQIKVFHAVAMMEGGGTGVAARPLPMSTDAKATKILARTFFNQLRSSGYTPTQVIAVATELIDLVATDIREGEKAPPAPSAHAEENRPAA